MNNKPLTDSTNDLTERTYKIAGELELHVKVTSNPHHIPLDALFVMAARINKKRSFLFVSKVLGKHMPVNPYTSLLSGTVLALLLQQAMQGTQGAQYKTKVQHAIEGLVHPEKAEAAYLAIMSERLPLTQPVAFIGFAETATAIGHAVYEAFGQGSRYLHSTREVIAESPVIFQFDEEHSHAVAHYGYSASADPAMLAEPEILVLVDDEITTGRTSLNIIRDLQGKYPKKIYYVLALLDWRTAQDRAQFAALEQELNVTIHVISLIQGETLVVGSSESLTVRESSGTLVEQEQEQEQEQELSQSQVQEPTGRLQVAYLDGLFAHAAYGVHSPYLLHSGRFGLTPASSEELDHSITQAAAELKGMRKGTKALCVGTGEFMYIPMRIAAQMGADVLYQSTTRSPIHVIDRADYAVQSGESYPSPEDEQVTHFFYNIPHGKYEEIFLFLEREASPQAMEPILRILQSRGLDTLHLVIFSPQTVAWKEVEVWKLGGISQ